MNFGEYWNQIQENLSHIMYSIDITVDILCNYGNCQSNFEIVQHLYIPTI